MEQGAFTCLAISTLCEPIFFLECRKFYRKYILRRGNAQHIANTKGLNSPKSEKTKTKGNGRKKVTIAEGSRVASSLDFESAHGISLAGMSANGEADALLSAPS